MGTPPDERVQYCRECGAAQSKQASFCEQCGGELDRPHSERPTTGTNHPRTGQPSHEQARPQRQDDGWSTLMIIAVILGLIFVLIPVALLLIAVIGAFVLDLGGTGATVPETTFDHEYDAETELLEIQTVQGDSFVANSVTFEGERISDPGAAWFEKDDTAGSGDIVSPGQTARIETDGDDFHLEVRWASESGEDSTILFSLSGPENESE